ncbi:MAG TPA: rhomboid family intramembrane serine protease [Bacteroidia bacterium]|nr:rhomboid family intramembrane serine protease [Bacteroidia bacterium]
MKDELKRMISSFKISLFFVAIMWLVMGIEHFSGSTFETWGVFPRTVSGLKGILFSPFIHGDFFHLFDNSIPMLVLGSMLFYFYRGIAWEISLLTLLLSGFWLWIMGRPSYHIGASGFIYGLSGFLFFSGVFRKNANLLTISLLVVFLYGSLIWGIFPIEEHISWEGHLTGGVAGAMLAWYYRARGPKAPEPKTWDDDPDDTDPYWLEDGDENTTEERKPINIRYFYRKG